MQKLEVHKGVERPASLNARTNGQEKYPFEDLKERNDFFKVPWFWYFGEDATEETADKERWNPRKHRDRVNNAARGYALKQNNAAKDEPDYNAETFKPIRFTVGALQDGVGVWRD